MVDNSMVDAIVRLPDKLFLTTGIPACLFILSKNRDGKDGTHRERNNEILFIDASKMGTMVSRKLRVLTYEDISKIADTYHAWRTSPNSPPSPPLEGCPQGGVAEGCPKGGVAEGAGEAYQNIDGFSKAATIAEVQKQDYKLTPGIYVGTEAEEDDGILFEDKMEALKAQLLTQFEKGEALKNQIIANFEKL
jgi:type I restriction enzyme M protein